MLPDVPRCQNHHFCRERLPNFLPGSGKYLLKRITRFPMYPEIIPNPNTKVTMKKQVGPVLNNSAWTHDIMIFSSDITISPLKHIPGVQAITNHKLGKHLYSEHNLALPDP